MQKLEMRKNNLSLKSEENIYFDLLISVRRRAFLLALLFHCGRSFAVTLRPQFMLLQELLLLKLFHRQCGARGGERMPFNLIKV